MENKLLKELYDYFYVRPELDEQESCRTRRTGAHCVWEDEI